VIQAHNLVFGEFHGWIRVLTVISIYETVSQFLVFFLYDDQLLSYALHGKCRVSITLTCPSSWQRDWHLDIQQELTDNNESSHVTYHIHRALKNKQNISRIFSKCIPILTTFGVRIVYKVVRYLRAFVLKDDSEKLLPKFLLWKHIYWRYRKCFSFFLNSLLKRKYMRLV